MTLTLSDPQAARKTTTKRIEISNLGQVSGAFAAHLHTARPFPPAVMPREWAIDVRSHPSIRSGAWSRRTFRQQQSPIIRCCCHQLRSLVWIHSLAGTVSYSANLGRAQSSSVLSLFAMTKVDLRNEVGAIVDAFSSRVLSDHTTNIYGNVNYVKTFFQGTVIHVFDGPCRGGRMPSES